MRGLLTFGVLLLGACSAPSPISLAGAPEVRLRNAVIAHDTVWDGRIVIDGSVKIYKGATLTILPGSEIVFIPRDDDRDGLGDGTLIVEGGLRAVGTRVAPIRFHSAAAEAKPGDWLEIRIDFAREALLRYCEIRDSAYTLHAHFTRAVLEDSHIHHNLDGCRLGQGNFVLRHNLIEANAGKGINFRNATVEIRNNIIRHNGSGIFLFETERAPLIEGNNIYANGDNLRLGDFFQRDLSIGSNWWGSADAGTVATSIYDRAKDVTLGQVAVAVAPAWLVGAGPRDALRLREKARVATGGFLDAAPTVLGEQLLLAGWDGVVRLFDGSGEPRWQQTLGEVLDAPLVSDGTLVFGQSWGREVFALRVGDGSQAWSFRYPDSPADDHRQGGVVLAGALLLVPAWNGTLYALDPQSGAERWRLVTPGPLRAAPSLDGEQIYLPGGDGVLRCLDLGGRLLWARPLGAPLLTTVAVTPAGPVVLDRAGTLTACERSGALRWTVALGESCYYAAPVVDRDALFVATAAGSLWQFDLASGATIWQQRGLGPVYATPLVMGGRLLVGDNDGRLSVLGRDSGELLATFRAAGAIQGGPIRQGAAVVFGSRDHNMYRLELSAVSEGP